MQVIDTKQSAITIIFDRNELDTIVNALDSVISDSCFVSGSNVKNESHISDRIKSVIKNH